VRTPTTAFEWEYQWLMVRTVRRAHRISPTTALESYKANFTLFKYLRLILLTSWWSLVNSLGRQAAFPGHWESKYSALLL